MLENMLDYFLEYELYEFACVVRDEVKRRQLVKNNNSIK
jgi:protein-arginine kinase activator protein McsA